LNLCGQSRLRRTGAGAFSAAPAASQRACKSIESDQKSGRQHGALRLFCLERCRYCMDIELQMGSGTKPSMHTKSTELVKLSYERTENLY
jgi:hypothetical protein